MKKYVLTKSQNQTKAIKAKCIDCICDPLDKGTELDQITNCMSIDCSLWEWRPLNKTERDKLKSERISLMTPEEKAKYDQKVQTARERLANNPF